MEIRSQTADYIYNVAGDMHLHNSPEVSQLLNKEKQAKLVELNSIPFFELLSKEMSKKILIDRKDEISKIKKALELHGEIILHGEPGLGKTTTLFQLSKGLPHVIYISVKDKSPISVLSYLINKIRQSNAEDLIELKDVAEAFDWLQTSLQKTNHVFIIDDCETDQDTVSKIITLEKFDAKFLYATRNKTLFEQSGKRFHECLPFSEPEVREFLKLHGKELQTLEFNEIMAASKGNPLYLFYFSNFPINPLPDTLLAFQQSIWSGLTTKQQEILALVSAPYFQIKIEELSELLEYDSILSFSEEIDKLSSLVKNQDGALEIFHPSFKEFILDTLHSKGILKHYLEKLGDFFLKKEEIIQATYLLIDIAPEKVDEFLYDVFPQLVSWGELQFALKVLHRKLSTVEDDVDKGYIYYHLGQVYHLLGSRENATSSVESAISYLTKADNINFLLAAKMSKAMNLAEEGSIVEATQMADEVFSQVPKEEKKVKAALLVNLSKLYVDLSEFNKGAAASKEAFEIFSELGLTNGMKGSLVNLVSCLTQNVAYRDQAEKYALHLLETLDAESDFSLEVVALNALTSIYREKEDYEKAKEYCQRAINLCQNYGLKDRAILNLVNFGNILRSEGKLEEAKKIYGEALVLSTQNNLKKEQTRIYWILADMQRSVEDYTGSLDFAEKSIEISLQINFHFGTANGYREKAETLELLNRNIDAAESYVKCAEYFGKVQQFFQSFSRYILKAINLYRKEGENGKANTLLNSLIEHTFKTEDFDCMSELITEGSDDASIAENFENLFKKYFELRGNRNNILRQIISFIGYCKDLDVDEGKTLFLKIIEIILRNVGQATFSYSVLGIAIEQSEWLLNEEDVSQISKRLTTSLPFFNVREVDDEYVILVTIQGKINLEVRVYEGELLCRKLAIATILILCEMPTIIIEQDEFLEPFCVISIQIFTDDMEEVLKDNLPPKENIFNQHVQSIHMQKADYTIPEMIAISQDYENFCNLNTNPEMRGSLYFFVTTFLGIKSHFYHINALEKGEIRRHILHSVGTMFEYSNREIDSSAASEFAVEFKKISEQPTDK